MKPTVTISDILSTFHLDEAPPGWEEAYQALEGAERFDRRFLTEQARLLGFGNELIALLEETVDTVNASPELLTAAAIVEHLLFVHPHYADFPPESFPLPDVGLFYLPILLAGVPALLDRHGEIGIAFDDSIALLRDIDLWVHEHRRRFGVWGLSEIKWLRHHFRLGLFAFGRLQYQPSRCSWPFRVYGDDRGASLVVAEGDLEFRRDGQFVDADTTSWFAPTRALTSSATERHGAGRIVTTFRSAPGGFVAHPVIAGAVMPDAVEYDASRWTSLFVPPGAAVAVHIPAGGPLESALVDESFARATRFFRRTFREESFPVYTCASWLLDPALERLLRRDSNIVAFGRRFLRVPVAGAHDRQHFERVFVVPKERIPTEPLDTSLKRALVDYVTSGGSLRMTGGFIPFPASR